MTKEIFVEHYSKFLNENTVSTEVLKHYLNLTKRTEEDINFIMSNYNALYQFMEWPYIYKKIAQELGMIYMSRTSTKEFLYNNNIKPKYLVWYN